MHHSRRDFLSGAAVAIGAASTPVAKAESHGGGPRIARIETFPIVYPTIGRFKFFEGPRGEPGGRPAVLVKITDEAGEVGWGQSVPTPRWSYETIESVDSTIRRHLAPALIGRDPADLDGIHAAMGKAIAPSFSTGQPICKAGIDLALHDLIGRRQGVSAASGESWHKLAGKRGPGSGRVTLSWTLNPKSLDQVEGLIAKGKERGYRHFNVKVAPDPKVDLELCRIVRRLVPDGFLWADANGGYDEATALEVAPKLADLGVPVLEQPLPANRLGGYAKLRRLKALPILMDEGIVSSVELVEFIRLGLLDGVAMKPARCGGLTEAKRQVEILRQEGLMVLGSGLTDPDVSLAASLMLFDACGLETPAALNGPQFLGGSVLKVPLEVSGGTLRVPEGPGLGVEVDESKIERLAVRPG